ncbi:benzoate 1,2-dioxygenase electron transfer component BenC [Rhizobium sp. C1]|uniref:benzoate 1,2-dioxygenase electron transfer component BenC n=1 Tax=Rhizobium sp. C1 TaxID=1349799 RepID=UPI001E638F46|nr:benzoate 1,2-dioxygenase electron transfer component BenC [Rhizobium sp. C1]MCD2179496.1 ring-hydroxylating dioxygenase ferredoxin reductase family protein [Rhizobium sp. C1]
MVSYKIALNFEDGVTRFVECGENEKVLDAAFRNRVNLPMDCSDGVCGTCKCRAESGTYDLGDDFIDDALTADEARQGLVLTCQMKPSSDCVIAVPATSAACKTGHQTFEATVTRIVPHNDAAYVVELDVDDPASAAAFLPGQYVNIAVPQSGQTRSYSFSSAPGDARVSFLIKTIPGGLMSSWLAKASAGERLQLTGPLGSFYLREVQRPLLLLAGGTGLAPFLSMLEELARAACKEKIHLVYGVTRDLDLVLIDQIAAFRERLPSFSFTTVVADAASGHPRKGWVTQHMPQDGLLDGEFDTYLCGPPPMVEAVRRYFDEKGLKPRSFHYEKFTPNASAREAA